MAAALHAPLAVDGKVIARCGTKTGKIHGLGQVPSCRTCIELKKRDAAGWTK